MATGHIRKRPTKDGKTSYQVILEIGVDPITGKRQRQFQTVHGTKKEAEAALTQMKCAMQNGGGIVQPSVLKLGDWLDQWMLLYQSNLSPSTATGYRYQIEKRIKPYLGRAPLKSLHTNQIQAWINDLTQQGLSGKTIKNTFLNLSAALDKAEALQMIVRNPCKQVEQECFYELQ